MDTIAGMLDEFDLGSNQRVIGRDVESQFDEFVFVEGIVWSDDVRFKRTQIIVFEN
jgi:hypothetical protein